MILRELPELHWLPVNERIILIDSCQSRESADYQHLMYRGLICLPIEVTYFLSFPLIFYLITGSILYFEQSLRKFGIPMTVHRPARPSVRPHHMHTNV